MSSRAWERVVKSALRRVLAGERGPHRHALVLGASLALRVTGRAGDPEAAVALAEAAIDDGRAGAVLEAVAGFAHQGAEIG